MPILMLLVAPALAGDLTWRWTPGQAVRYHAETLLTTPASPIYMAPRNDEARATQVEVVLDLSCTAQVHGKGWDLACAIEKAKVAGVAVTGEQEALDRIFAGYSTALAACTIKMAQLPDGRISDVDLVGFANVDTRTATILDLMRQLARRAIAPLDLQLPKDGTDPGKAWRQTGVPLAAEAFSSSGVSGGLTLKNEVATGKGAGTHIDTTGQGNLMISRPDRDIGDQLNVVVSGEARFDGSTDTLAYRTISNSMEAIGANIGASGWDGYRQVGWIGRWDAGGAMEGADGAVAPSAP